MIGTILNSRYRLDKELGSGGFATVYAGYDMQKNRLVAVKVTNDLISRNSEYLKAFLDELSALTRLPDHPNVVGILDYGVVGEKTFLIMDYAPHGTLESLLQKYAPKPLDFALAGRFFVQMAGALSHAHQYNIIHRDIKPENMLFMTSDRLVVSDFGLARQFKSQMTQSINLFGSPPYVAPERWADKVGPASDVYALGIIMHQMLTGSLPFQATDPLAYLQLHVYQSAPRLRDLRPDLPVGLDELLTQMLAKQPESRPPASELLSLYQQALQQATGYYQTGGQTAARRGATLFSSQASGPVRNPGKTQLGADILPPAPADMLPEVRQWTTAIQANPIVPDHFARRARAYSEARAHDKALADYTEALKLDPRNPVMFFERGKVLHEIRHHTEAIEDMTRALKLAPQFPNAYEQRAEAFLATGQFDAALLDYDAAMRFNSQNPEIYNKRVLAYKQRADFFMEAYRSGTRGESALQSALLDYGQALQLNPQDARLYKERGNAYRALGQFRKAITDYNKAIRLGMEHAEVFTALGDVYMQQKKYKQAITEYNRALKLPGWNVAIYKSRAYAYFAQRKFRQAQSDYKEAVRLMPADAELWCQRGNCYFAMKDYSKALADYDEALRLDSSELGPLYNKAMALAALGRVNEAIAILQYYLGQTKERRVQRMLKEAIARLEATVATTALRSSRRGYRP